MDIICSIRENSEAITKCEAEALGLDWVLYEVWVRINDGGG